MQIDIDSKFISADKFHCCISFHVMDYQGPPMRIYQKHSAAMVRIMNWSHFYVDGLDEFHCFISGLMLANHNGLDNQRAIAQCSMPSSVE